MRDADLPESNQPRPIDGRAAARAFVSELLTDCQREICFVGSNIDSLFDDAAIVNIIKNRLLSHSRIQLRLLVDDTRRSIQDSHRLLPLIQKLTSSIEVRLAPPRFRHPDHLALIVDETGYLRCLNNKRYQGRAAMHAPLAARELKLQFQQIWDEAVPDPATRRLTL